MRHNIQLMAAAMCLLLSACSVTQSGFPERTRLVYANDSEGRTTAGDKEALIEAVRLGRSIRVVTHGRTILHAADAQFLSVFEGEVFAQLTPIDTQRPTREPVQILFREPGVQWHAIVGTNGFMTAFMDGKDPVVRAAVTYWYTRE